MTAASAAVTIEAHSIEESVMQDTILVPEGEHAEGVLRAFAIGYHDGYVRGYVPGDESPYDDTPLQGFYKRGYDAGVADFCEQTLD